MVCQVRNEGHRGGAIIDLVNARIQGGSEWSREWLGSTLQECHKVFKNQVTAWAKHGQIVDPTKEFFVHRVLTGEDSRFKFTKGNSIEVTDWEMFTLSEVMVPKSLIDLETAGKILFIGKSIKILGRTEKTLGTSRLLLGLEEVGSAGL